MAKGGVVVDTAIVPVVERKLRKGEGIKLSLTNFLILLPHEALDKEIT